MIKPVGSKLLVFLFDFLVGAIFGPFFLLFILFFRLCDYEFMNDVFYCVLSIMFCFGMLVLRLRVYISIFHHSAYGFVTTLNWVIVSL